MSQFSKNAEVTYKSSFCDLPDGARLACYTTGPENGPVVVLIPGSWADHHTYDEMVAAMNPQIKVVIIELRGHGKSSPPVNCGSIEMFANDVLIVAEQMNLSQYYIGGHSIGGMVAIQAAGMGNNSVAGCISIEGWTHYTVLDEAFQGDVDSTLPEILKEENQKIRISTSKRYSSKQIESFLKIWREWNGYPILEKLKIPVLELWGDRNHLIPPSRCFMQLPERNNIILKWIKGASHYLLQESPIEVAKHITAFILNNESTSH